MNPDPSCHSLGFPSDATSARLHQIKRQTYVQHRLGALQHISIAISAVKLLKMDGQHKIGPTQGENGDDRLLLDTGNVQKDGARCDSTYMEGIEKASKDSQDGSPVDAELENELFGSPPNSAVPQFDGSAPTAGHDVTAEALVGETNSPGNAAAKESVTGTGQDANDHLLVNKEPEASSTSEAALMPPPAAPASMLLQLQISKKAKPAAERVVDEAVIARLISVSVILFRQGTAANAKKLAQFTIDLVGKQKWDEELPAFMKAEPLPSDNDAVLPLLSGTVDILKPLDRTSSAFLEGILYAWS